MSVHGRNAGLSMRRLCLLFCLIGAVAAGALPAQAAALRFPPTGKHAFLVDLPKGWQTKTDARGGLLLIPPSQSQHAMIYLGILVDDKLRGQPVSAVAAQVAKSVGVATFDKEEPARMTVPSGGCLRGTAFYGKITEPRGLCAQGEDRDLPARAEHLGAGLDRDAAGDESGRVQDGRSGAQQHHPHERIKNAQVGDNRLGRFRLCGGCRSSSFQSGHANSFQNHSSSILIQHGPSP